MNLDNTKRKGVGEFLPAMTQEDWFLDECCTYTGESKGHDDRYRTMDNIV